MLVLTRKSKESLMIGEDIEVVIIECKDGSVKLGIEAPKNVKIFRKEIFEEIKSENSKALDADLSLLNRIIDKK